MAATFIFSNQQILDTNGDPIVGAKLESYAEGTSTPLATYSDEALTTANANPASGATTGNQVTGSDGRFGNIYLQALAYKFILKDDGGNTIWTIDNFNPDGGVVSLAGDLAFTGNPTFSGNPAFTGSPDFSGAANKTAIRSDLLIGYADILSYGAQDTADDNVATTNALASGKPVVIQNTGTDYEWQAPVYIDTGDKVIVQGIGRPVITAASNINIFSTITAGGVRKQAKRVHISGLVFDGQWDLTGQTYPYRDVGTSSMSIPITVQGDIDDPDSICIIEDCEFRDIKQSVALIQYFNTVIIRGNRYTKTWDWIIQQCRNVVFEDNYARFIPEMGVSIIEDNQFVRVRNNYVFGSSGHGISVDNFISQQLGTTGTVTVTEIASGGYAAGAQLTLTLATNGFLTDDQIGQQMVIGTGSDSCRLRIESRTNSQLGTVRAIDAVPAALQNVATSDFVLAGPGNKDVQINDNTLIGCELDAIATIRGFKHVRIYDNQILFQGLTPDSEVSTTCRGAKGSTTLELTSATGFATGDWIFIAPEFGVADMFVAKISNLTGTTATLSKALPTQYLNDPIYKAWHSVDDLSNTNTCAGINQYGFYRTSAVNEPGEDSLVYGNTIRNYVYAGYSAGGSNSLDGVVHDTHVFANKIILDDYFDVASQASAPTAGILFEERTAYTGGRNEKCSITNNIIRTNGVTMPSIRAIARDTNADSQIQIFGNIEDGASGIEAETTGASDLSDDWGIEDIAPSLVTKYRDHQFNGDVGINAEAPAGVDFYVNGVTMLGESGATSVGSASAVAVGLGDVNTGFYRASLNTLSAAANGVQGWEIDTAGNVSFPVGVTVGPTTAASGSDASPVLRVGDTDTGFYRPGANILSAACGGTETWRSTTTGLSVGSSILAPTAALDVFGNDIRIRTSQTPASASAAGNAGEICWDANYIYVCTATNTWKRVAIATW